MKYQIADTNTISSEMINQYGLKLATLLHNRTITSPEAADGYIDVDYAAQLHSPFLLHDMEQAVDRILRAIENQEKIVIYADYDSDGIPGSVVLHDFFVKIGFSNFYTHIPHRHYDGFGLKVSALEKLLEAEQPDVVITVDCGVSDLEAADFLKQKKVDLIITDHHEPKDTLPNAVAVVNPKCGDTYPFTELCGAAVIFKVVQAVLERNRFDIPEGYEKWWLDMVGIATIADMVPLHGENRVLAYYGLQVLKKTRRPGLQHLLRKQRLPSTYVTEDDIGFTIGPRINAASRMDTPEDAYLLLSVTDEHEAGEMVSKLDSLNTKRKTEVAKITRSLHSKIELIERVPEVIVFGNPDWRPSLVGLAANKLAEEYARPAFVWGRDGNNIHKGSCRSGGESSVITLMEAAADIFQEYGGHHYSGGFTVHDDFLPFFEKRMNEAFAELGSKATIKEPAVIDMKLLPEDITHMLLKEQKKCAPFGCGNHKPLYAIDGVTVATVQCFGKQKEHTKLLVENIPLTKEAICFFRTPDTFTTLPESGKKYMLLVHIEESFFMNRLQTRLRIVDVLPVGFL